MLIAIAILAITAPASAACGKVFAHMNGWENEDAHTALAAFLPPYGAFCAINILIKDNT